MKAIDVSSEDVDPPDWTPDLAEVGLAVFDALSVTDFEVSILLCNDHRISELNRTYRQVSEPTDVLSFSQSEGIPVPTSEADCLMGDIVISLESVLRNAETAQVNPREEAIRVTVHGLLHLAGYEHTGTTLEDEAAATHPMLSLQEQIVSELIKEQNQ